MKNFKKKPKISEEASILTKRAKSEKVIYAFAFVLFTVYAVSIIYPLLYLVINSFQDAYTYTQNRVMGNANPFALPEVWHFENYVKAINISVQDSQNNEVYMYMMFLNSIWYCGIAVCGQVFMSSVTGYVMAKYKFKAREFIYAIVIFSMTIPIVGTTGSMMKLVGDLGIYNTPLYVVVVSLGGLGFNFMVMYGFFKSVSWSYAEAVFLDGGGHFTAFFKVMLPQTKTLLITLGIVAFIGTWNDYMTPLLYIPDYPTIASGLYRIKESATRNGDMPYYFAGLMFSVIPVLVIYICFSDTIMKNFSFGGLKG